ncbi:MAG: hypothetical protein ABSD20_07800 [Terriglobales bacterium]
MRRTILIGLAVLGALLTGPFASAQTQSFPEPTISHEDYQAEVFGGFSLLHAKPASGFSYYNLYGWNVSATEWANSWFGIMLDASAGYHKVSLPGPDGKTVTNVDQYSFLAGPRFRLVPNKSRFDGTLQPMVGSGLGHAPLSTPGGLENAYEARWAYQLGFAGDYNFTPRLAVTLRPGVYWTRFGSSTQTDWKLATGVVYRFGKSQE